MRWEATVYVDGPWLSESALRILLDRIYEAAADAAEPSGAKWGVDASWPDEFNEVSHEGER